MIPWPLRVWLGLVSRLWFAFFAGVFRVVNSFWPRRIVSRVTNPLLLQSATALARQIRNREITSVELVDAMTERLDSVSALNAVVVRNVEATREEARAVDRRVASGNVPPPDEAPFLGVPFTLKDCIFVKGLRCTAGIPARAQRGGEAEDAAAVRNLRLAGAIGPLAVTNVSEVCMWWESANGVFGRTRNPYDDRKIVGGSSGGEGCLISAGGSIIGIGSDIGGSIRMPSYFNGIFGHKPTSDVVSLHGSYPPTYGYQKVMCTKGPMCRFAEDLGPMLLALGGPAAATQLKFPQVDLKNIRVFYMEGIKSKMVSPLHPEVKGALINVVKYFETRYEVTCIRVDLPIVHKILPVFMNDLGEKEAPSFASAMTDFQGEIRAGPELVRKMLGRSPHTFAALLLCLLESLTRSPKLAPTAAEEAKLVAMRRRLRSELEALLGSDGVFLFPPHPTPVPFHCQPHAQPFNFVYTALFNSLALPTTSVPVGLDSTGMPLGVQVVASPHNDGLGIAVARELERAFGGWTNFPA